MTTANAEQCLRELKGISTKILKAANVAARNEGLVLVNGKEITMLRELFVVVADAFKASVSTRDYKDVLEANPSERYNGKRCLIRRQDAERVFQVLCKFKGFCGPTGCAVEYAGGDDEGRAVR